MKAAPKVTISKNFSIGYSEILGRTDKEIVLNSGVHFLLGRNGRGKTTLLRSLTGILKPKSGFCKISGSLQFLEEDLQFDSQLSGRKIIKALVPKSKLITAMEFAEEIELDVKKPYGFLSTGNKRKINSIITEFATSAREGDVLFLDEPFTGLDVYIRAQLEALWVSKQSVVRLVSAHPDQDSMPISSAILISEGRIEHLQPESPLYWRDLKETLK